jgi:hypothetical protein
LLQEVVNAHNSTHISSKVAPARSYGEVLDGVEPVSVDHKVTVVLVDMGRLASVPVVEKLGEGFALDVVDRVHVKPSAVTWQDYGVSLRD